MSPLPDGFKCKRCGKCCRAYVQVTEEDIWRWAVEFRDDILQRISTDDFLIQPVIKEGITRCPFLKKSASKKAYICRIHNTKPKTCIEFPISMQPAEYIGCPGVKQIED